MKDSINSFRQAVEETTEVKDGYRVGLKALKKTDVSKVEASDTRKIDGSLDIDGVTKAKRPNEARWDYAIGYNGRIYFMEVHPACTGNIPEIMKKLKWVKDWLNTSGNKLNDLPKGTPLFSWIATDAGVHIPAVSSHYKMLATKGLLPKRKLVLI